MRAKSSGTRRTISFRTPASSGLGISLGVERWGAVAVRLAAPADKAEVVRLLRDSREAAGFDAATGVTGFTFPFEPVYAEHLFRAHISTPFGFCHVLDLGGDKLFGVLMATASEHPFGPVWLARETVWWIEPGARGHSAVRMLDAYEDWAERLNCKFVGMAGMGEDPEVAKLYLRRGYRKAETHFLKAL
jgi:hypothetical protein